MNPAVNMEEFGFSESEPEYSPYDAILDILAENPEISARLDPYDELLADKAANSFGADFFLENPDVALQMEAAGKDTEKLDKDLRTAFAALALSGSRRITDSPFGRFR